MSTTDAESRESADEAVDLIETFLARIGAGDLDAAQEALATGARITFPGSVVHADLAQMRAGSRSRYRWVNKHRDDYVAHHRDDGSTHVVSTGRLFGENLHGVHFDGVRYVDLFEIRDGRIVRQDVYNDLAESGVLAVSSHDDLPEIFRTCGDHE